MNEKKIQRIRFALYGFIIASIIIIIYRVLFYINQMINIKYYFDQPLVYDNPASYPPICNEEYVLESILTAKIEIVYALGGLILCVYCLKAIKKIYNYE